ncbi:MAG TPA: c-type cytochrome biogenesis protein CcmI, partial [Stellaceae bacterium]|nr:c-type cytochrome biogenesis protein CcmI [Stellaceae bacterium]
MILVWLVFAVLAALVVALVIWPLAATRHRFLSRAAYDGAVYRDQLKEIARDVERGLLTAGEAASARLEVERRLLAAADGGTGAPPAASAVTPRVLTVALAVLVPLSAVAFYLVHGSPRLPDQPYAARAAERAVANAQGGL